MTLGPTLDPAALAEEVQRRGPALSRQVIEQMYRNPFWAERFGPRGRTHADQDGGYHVAYLVEAVRSGSPSVMTRYAQWLRSVLVSRGMCTRHLAENFARLADAFAADGEPALPIAVDLLRQAEAALLYEAPAARALQDGAPGLAHAVAGQLRAAHPEWDGGAQDGWARCEDDLLYHLSYLADAVASDRAELFVSYARFMAGFLDKRGVALSHLQAVLVALGERLQADGAPANVGLPVLQAALAALGPP